MRVLDPSTGPARLLIGRDTRESGAWIERELAYGAQLSGATVVAAGVLPTPAVAYLTRTSDITLGAVISASHNPFEDNGIKVFSGGGQKFTEELERRVEQAIADDSWSVEAGDAPALAATDLTGRYRGHLREVLADAGGLRGARLVVDCANGATTSVAPAGLCRPRLRRRPDRRLARRTQHQPRLRLDASRRRWRRAWSNAARSPASPSTATATARSLPTSTGGWSTATA